METPRTGFSLRTAAVMVAVLGLLLAGVQSGNRSGRTEATWEYRLSAAVTHKSWNHHVKCHATVATLRQVLGKQKNRHGGATYRDGKFKPGIPDRRDFSPPCVRHHTPTFVQLNRVKVGSCNQINEDGDWTCTLTDPSVPRRRTTKMSSIHVETDKSFRHHSGWSKPPGGKLIDIQGFVFWDSGHTKEAWHFFTGWEIHSLTAWRHWRRR